MPRVIAVALRQYGVDITMPGDVGLRTRDDQAHFAFCRAQARAIVTDDVDFLEMGATTPDHPGVVFCRRSKHSVVEIIRFVQMIYEVLDSDDMIGRVEYL